MSEWSLTEIIDDMPDEYQGLAVELVKTWHNPAALCRFLSFVSAEAIAISLQQEAAATGRVTYVDLHKINEVDLADDVASATVEQCGNPLVLSARRDLADQRAMYLAAYNILRRTVVSEAAFMALPPDARASQVAAYEAGMVIGHKVLALEDIEVPSEFVRQSNIQLAQSNGAEGPLLAATYAEVYDHTHWRGEPVPAASSLMATTWEMGTDTALVLGQVTDRMFEGYNPDATLETLGRWANAAGL